MSVFLKKVEWYNVDDPTTAVAGLSPLIDIKSLTARKGTDVKNNILDITLKNANSKYVSSGLIRFQEEDVIKAYCKFSNDATDIGTAWETSDDLLGTYYLKEFRQTSTSGKHQILLSCVDRAYILFNKVFTKTYGVISNDYWTAPGIFRNVTRINSPTEDTTNGYIGTDNDSGVYFSLDSKFLSEGGYLTDYRADVSTTLNGAMTDADTTITVDDTSSFKEIGTLVIGTEHIYYSGKTSTTFTGCVRGIDDTTAEAGSDEDTVYQGFPLVDLTKVWKPLYEWFQDLSNTTNTNYEDETTIGGSLKYNRAFVIWMDKDNKLHWIPADQTVDTEFTIGSDQIYELTLNKGVFDSVNMVIYNVGEDMYGSGAIWYYFNEQSEVQELKMRYQPMTELIDTILNEEYKNNSGSFPSAVAGDSNRRFPSSYPYTPDFLTDANKWEVQIRAETASTEASNDSDFNTLLRYAAFWRGRSESISITSLMSGLRYKGRVTLRGTNVNPGDMISVTDSKTGLLSQRLRVIDVTHNCTIGQWSTTLDVEQDEQTL